MSECNFKNFRTKQNKVSFLESIKLYNSNPQFKRLKLLNVKYILRIHELMLYTLYHKYTHTKLPT